MEFILSHYDTDNKSLSSLLEKYGKEGAAKILSESVHLSLDNAYIAGTLLAVALSEKVPDRKTFLQNHPYLFNKFVYEFLMENFDTLSSLLVPERDYGYSYSSVKTLIRNYVFKYNGEPVETIQWAWMRIAVQVAAPDLQEVKNTYDMLSQKEMIHATPTCINAGYRIPQLESCFLARIGDNMISIADVQKLLLIGSKCNGGFGVFLGDIRHSRVANRGNTKGIPGLCKMLNGLIPYADQLGSRPMAVAVYLPVWHCDICEFIQMKDENSPLDLRATLLNYAVCVPDLFRKRCLSGDKWSLFCPRECKKVWVKANGGNPNNTFEVDKAPSLCDMHGKEFEEYYLLCEKAGIASETLNARDLDAGISTYRCRIGEPYIFYTDNVNRKSNHSHMGTIVQSNLCSEIVQYTGSNESPSGEITATCDLATINVASLVSKKTFNWSRCQEITRQLVRNLNRVLDRTSSILSPDDVDIEEVLQDPTISEKLKEIVSRIPKDPTTTSRKKTRAIGIGIMGLASCFSLLGIRYGSKESFELGERIRACIYYTSLDESANLALKEGPYPTFEGSPLSQGILSPDLWRKETEYIKSLNLSVEIKEQLPASSLIFRDNNTEESLLMYNDANKRYSWKEVDPSLFGVSSSWDDLRQKVKKGVRNSLLTCQMPNATTSGAFGVSASIEPFYELFFTSDNTNGKDTTLYDSLRQVCIEEGIYDSKKIAKALSSKNVPEVIKNLFPPAFSINKKKYLLFIQRMGYYIDQAQSTNIFFDKPNASYLSRLSHMNWVNGAKTEYYLRRLAGEEKINPFLESKCSLDGDCVSCQ